MWKKVKTALCITFSVLGAICVIIASFFIGRSSTDGKGSSGNDERANTIRTGLDESSGRIESSKNHTRRAREILQEAIKRGKEKANI